MSTADNVSVSVLQGMHGGDGDEDGERRMLEREAEQVEMEIRLLEDEMEQQTQHPHGTNLAQLPQAIVNMESNMSADDIVVARKRSAKECSMIEEELRLAANVSGVVLTDVKCEILKTRNKLSIVRSHQLRGHCSQVFFDLKLTTEEKQIGLDDSEVVATELKISIDGKVPEQLENIIPRLETELSADKFFLALVPCVRWTECRHKVFLHFKQKYNDSIYFTEDSPDLLLISNPQKQGVLWAVHWDVIISRTYTVTPLIQLLIKAANSAVKSDRQGVLSSAPTQFQQMLSTLGVTQAIDAIIRVVLFMADDRSSPSS